MAHVNKPGTSQPTKSLQEGLAEINSIVKQLDNFKPEVKKKVGRPRANPDILKPDAQALPETVAVLCSLSQSILEHLNVFLEENQELKSRVAKLEALIPDSKTTNSEPSARSFAAVEAGKSVQAPKAINRIDNRLDQIEQDSISSTLKFDGNVITNIIEVTKERSGDNTNHPTLKQRVVDIVNGIRGDIVKRENIVSTSVIGRERKP